MLRPAGSTQAVPCHRNQTEPTDAVSALTAALVSNNKVPHEIWKQESLPATCKIATRQLDLQNHLFPWLFILGIDYQFLQMILRKCSY